MRNLELLIYCDTPNQAEEFASTVRTLGYAITPVHAEDSSQFFQVLESGGCDLAIVAVIQNSAFQLPKHLKNEEHAPILALIDGSEKNPGYSAGELIQAGVQAVSDINDYTHTVHCIQQLLAHHDLTCQVRKEEQTVQVMHQQLMVLLQSTTQAVAFVHEGFHVYANPAYLRTLGYDSLEQLQAIPLLNLLPDSGERKSLANALKNPVVNDRKNQGLPLRFKTNEDRIVEYQVKLAPSHFDGESVTQVILAHEVSSTLSNELPVPRAPRRKITDPVTRLFSQSHMMTLLESTIGHAQDSNDEYMLYLIHLETGPDKPEYTDQCMRAAAERLKGALDSGDVLGRYSANSFILLTLNDANRPPEIMAEKLRVAVGNLGGLLHGRTWSRISGVIIDKYCNDSEHALSRLKQVFVQAQDNKTPVEIDITQFVHTPGSQMIDNTWARRVSTILQNNTLSLNSLPVVSLKEDGWERYALQLLLHDEQGVTLPLERFRGTVVSTGMAESVDRWIIFNAARELSSKLQLMPTARFFIPQIGTVVLQNDLHTWIAKVFEQFRLPANSIILQVTAESALDFPNEFTRLCQQMADLNCGICVTGHNDPTVTHELFDHSRNRINYISPHHYLVNHFEQDRECYDQLQIITEQCHREGTLTMVSEAADPGILSALWNLGIDLVISRTFSDQKDHTMELDLGATLSA